MATHTCLTPEERAERRRAQCRAAQARYSRTAKGRATIARYKTTTKCQVVNTRYRTSPRGVRTGAISNARRTFLGARYLWRVPTVEQAQIISAHIRNRVHAFKQHQSRA